MLFFSRRNKTIQNYPPFFKYAAAAVLSFCLAASGASSVYPQTLSEKYQEAKESSSEAREALEEAKDDLNEAQQQLVDVMADIADLEDLIDEAEGELADAEEQEEYQRTLMEERMQYMYENNGESMLATILSSSSLAEILNKIEYATEVYTQDKELTDEYTELVESISEMKDCLEAEYDELEGLQEDLEELTEKLSKEVDLSEAQYKEAAALVEKYQTALAEEAAQEALADEDYDADSGYTDAVAYARQFIGYSYKWGGNSLTGGIDCSHFIYQVMKNTGHYSGSYRTSAAWRSAGKSVSISDAQAGDILCYSGHVSIYTGEGTEVHARSRKYGICETSVTWSRVVCVRRL